MTYSDASDHKTQNLLDALTEALLAERDELDPIMDQYGVSKTQVEDFIQLIYRLQSLFTRQQPTDEFVRRLERDLIGRKQGIFDRWRYLPGRVQIAAGLAVVAGGVMIVSRRRGFELPDTDIPLLQQR